MEERLNQSQPVSFSQLTPITFLERSAAVFADKTAVIYEGRQYSYAELRRRVHRLAGALRRAGVQPGDRVAYLAPNTPPLLEAHFAVPLTGAILVAINIRLHSQEIAYILNHAEAKLLVVDSELASLVASVASTLRSTRQFVIVRDTQPEAALPGKDYEEFLAEGEDEFEDFRLEDENDVISVNYTSGTTGQPKGVMYTHRGAYLNALGVTELLEVQSDSRYLWVVPMFHCNGWCFTWGVTAMGATHVCLRKPDPEKMLQAIGASRVTHFCCAPTVLINLLHHPAAAGFRLEHPVRVAVGGAPPSPAMIRDASQWGIDVAQIYGLTETYGPFTVCEWRGEWNSKEMAERAQILALQGVPHVLSGAALRVVDGQMQDVAADGETLGEVVMRGNIVMKGYYNDPPATEAAFRGGWFHSGDLAVMHPSGYIEIRDRKKDVIISGGENVSTVEVEKALCEHPDVLEAAVIAVPHEKWGEVPKAFVTLKTGRQTSEQQIVDFCRQRLAHFKCPQAVVFGSLPKTSTGKVKKFELREKEWAGFEKRVH
ncbi:MAG: acyl-CoA synthetase [Acidobacteria bacterium RIFCSPLOWO2_02_FULL_59_13]|nr:MAG: acyl-CoA synthetase [Acidobacteria bacterium RIFCSPLOWO2_02_FULL_59_13]